MPLVLLLLAAAWCAYIAVWWRDSRKTSTAGRDRMDSFGAGMNTLANSVDPLRRMAPRARGVPQAAASFRPRSVGAAARRRRGVVLVLSGAAAVSLAAGLVLGPIVLAVHAMIDLALAAYAYAWLRLRNLAAEREIKVRMLHPDGVVLLHSVDGRPVDRRTAIARRSAVG